MAKKTKETETQLFEETFCKTICGGTQDCYRLDVRAKYCPIWNKRSEMMQAAREFVAAEES